MERAGLFTFGLTLSLILGACKSSSTPSARFRENTTLEESELKMTAMHVQSYSDHGLEWELASPFGEMYTRNNVMRLKNMDILLYEKGQKSTNIHALDGVMSTGMKPTPESKEGDEIAGHHLEQGDMYLSGDVVMISTDGSKLTTDWVHYHKKTDLVTSTAPVRVVRTDSVTNGVGMEASSDLSNLRIFNQTLVIPERKQTAQ